MASVTDARGAPEVQLSHGGRLRGWREAGLRVFKGIRYAAPPVGDLRFRAPVPPEPWTEVADAGEYGCACPQPPLPGIPLDLGARQDEDCLTLNIWAPTGGAGALLRSVSGRGRGRAWSVRSHCPQLA